MRELDMHRLRTFATVAETASMTRAAERLNQTQGAISQQVRKLETELGQQLFVRRRSGLSLTGAGERMIGKARRILQLNDAIWCDMTGPACAGEVSVGVPPDLVGRSGFERAIRDFAAQFPDVRIRFSALPSPQLRESVAGGALDLAILEEHASEQTGKTLGVDRLVWVGATSAKAPGREILPVSLVSESCAFRPHVMAALELAARPWESVFETGSIEATEAMIRMDLAVGVSLAGAMPPGLEEVPADHGLPPLPAFNLTLAVAPTAAEPCAEMARFLERRFAASGPEGIALRAAAQ